MRKLLVFVSLALAGCNTTPADSTSQAAAGESTSEACRNEGLNQFVGRERSPKTESALLRQSGAKVVRWVEEGMMVSMEFRSDRVTAYLDANKRIERVSCG